MSIQECVHRVQQRIEEAAKTAGRDPKEVTLCAATKVQSDENIRTAIAAGITVCGENRVQELTAHLLEHTYEGAEVHFIGHLQTNKVNKVVGKVSLIHSVDSDRLLNAIENQAAKLNIQQDILLEVNIGEEESKGGISAKEVHALAQLAQTMPHIRLRGLMAIPPVSAQPGANRPFFAQMRQLLVDIRSILKDNETDIVSLSMGMSADYQDAVAEGATLVRLGTALFGPRAPKPQ